jgi:exodeoxyribonuclease VII small subunit
MLPKKTAVDSAAAPDFEASMKRLEQIVEELEGGELSLEDSIARYEEGVKLSRGLTARLDEAEKRIEKLVEEPGDDGPRTQPVELDLKSGESSGELPF